MHDFYVMDGKKLIDFKPRHVNYERAFLRKYDEIINSQSDMSMHEMKETYPDEFKKRSVFANKIEIYNSF